MNILAKATILLLISLTSACVVTPTPYRTYPNYQVNVPPPIQIRPPIVRRFYYNPPPVIHRYYYPRYIPAPPIIRRFPRWNFPYHGHEHWEHQHRR